MKQDELNAILDKHTGCHVECSEYAKVSAKAKIERTGRQSQYSMDNYFFDTNRRQTMSKLQRTVIDGVIFSGFCIVAYAYIALAETICRALGVGA